MKQIARNKMKEIINKFLDGKQSEYTADELGNFCCTVVTGFIVCCNQSGNCFTESCYTYEAALLAMEELKQLDKEYNRSKISEAY